MRGHRSVRELFCKSRYKCGGRPLMVFDQESMKDGFAFADADGFMLCDSAAVQKYFATAKADSSKRPCLLCTRKRTCAVHSSVSAMGQ